LQDSTTILDDRYTTMRSTAPTMGDRQKRWRQIDETSVVDIRLELYETSVADIRLERAINHPLDTDERFAAICRPS
jgi:hypothetical protein